MKIFAIIYSVLCYLVGVAALIGLILFIGDLIIPWTVNKGSPIAPAFTGAVAVIWNLVLVFIWGMQHSIMADPGFKEKWTKIVPPVIERSTYLLVVALMTGLLIALWAPLPSVLWDFSGSLVGTILLVGFFLGWVITFISTFLINHFHLFGLQQAIKSIEKMQSKTDSFVTPLFYKFVRHPMMTGVLIAVWCAPTLTVGRLCINIAFTAYIILGTQHEEKTLIADLGEQYEEYRKKTPMLIPWIGRG